MRSDQALRYLLLKHLWKLRSLTDRRLHAEIAKSLDVEQVAGLYVVSWTQRNVSDRIECAADRFLFYKRGDVPGPKAGSRPTSIAHDNEQAARHMAAQILGVDLPAFERRPSISLYGDVWRWPLICTIGAMAAFVVSRSVLPFVLAGTAILELGLRTRRLYFVLVAALVLGGYSVSAVLLGLALAGVTSLAGTTARGRIDALGYLTLAYLAWHMRPDLHSTPPEWFYVLPFVLVSACVWTALWLSFEGPRLSILLAPLMAVSFLYDGRSDLALVHLSICSIYSAWLVIPVRMTGRGCP